MFQADLRNLPMSIPEMHAVLSERWSAGAFFRAADGDRIIIWRLNSKPEWNKTHGIILGFDPVSDRVCIQHEGTGAEAKVKKSNVLEFSNAIKLGQIHHERCREQLGDVYALQHCTESITFFQLAGLATPTSIEELIFAESYAQALFDLAICKTNLFLYEEAKEHYRTCMTVSSHPDKILRAKWKIIALNLVDPTRLELPVEEQQILLQEALDEMETDKMNPVFDTLVGCVKFDYYFAIFKIYRDLENRTKMMEYYAVCMDLLKNPYDDTIPFIEGKEIKLFLILLETLKWTDMEKPEIRKHLSELYKYYNDRRISASSTYELSIAIGEGHNMLSEYGKTIQIVEPAIKIIRAKYGDTKMELMALYNISIDAYTFLGQWKKVKKMIKLNKRLISLIENNETDKASFLQNLEKKAQVAEYCRQLAEDRNITIPEQPSQQFVLRKCSNGLCSNVEKTPRSFRVCGYCKVAKYCCKKCQHIHWKRTHRKRCKKKLKHK